MHDREEKRGGWFTWKIANENYSIQEGILDLDFETLKFKVKGVIHEDSLCQNIFMDRKIRYEKDRQGQCKHYLVYRVS